MSGKNEFGKLVSVLSILELLMWALVCIGCLPGGHLWNLMVEHGLVFGWNQAWSLGVLTMMSLGGATLNPITRAIAKMGKKKTRKSKGCEKE